jgi:hypothetical protein
MAVLSRAALLGAILALAACSGSSGNSASVRRLPDARLPTLAGIPGAPLSSCPTDKCLTVLVAPWCGVCRAEASNLVQFRRYLDAHGVSSRIVVGLSDDLPAIKKFAAVFGSDALIDADGVMSSRATPLMLISDREGRILKVVEGFPSQLHGAEELANYLDLI